MEYGQHHYMITTALDVKFGVVGIFVPESHEVEANLGNNLYKIIQ